MDKINLYNLLITMNSDLIIEVNIYTRNNNEMKEVKTYIGSVSYLRVEMLKNNAKLFKVARVFYINYTEVLEISAEI